MIQDYTQERYNEWLATKGITFKRKLENETAFDGLVKIYSIKTDNININKALDGLYFGDLGVQTGSGILLRKFASKNSWPHTVLSHLNMVTGELKAIKESESSYLEWPVSSLDNGRYEIKLSPSETVLFIDR